MPKKKVYKVIFQNEGKLYEIYAKSVGPSSMLGFIEVEGLLFGEHSTIVVDPSEERLRTEFGDVERTYIPMHAVVRIDQVTTRGAAKISTVSKDSNVRRFPTPLPIPSDKDA